MKEEDLLSEYFKDIQSASIIEQIKTHVVPYYKTMKEAGCSFTMNTTDEEVSISWRMEDRRFGLVFEDDSNESSWYSVFKGSRKPEHGSITQGFGDALLSFLR